jgi:hypothetical protein
MAQDLTGETNGPLRHGARQQLPLFQLTENQLDSDPCNFKNIYVRLPPFDLQPSPLFTQHTDHGGKTQAHGHIPPPGETNERLR